MTDGQPPVTNSWQDRVTVDPAVCHGQACITGTRILVTVILDNLAAGHSPDDVVADYSQLALEDVRAAIAYAAELAHERVAPISGT